MAKRTPPGQEEYRPLNQQRVQSVLGHKAPVHEPNPDSETVEALPPAPPERDEPAPGSAEQPENTPQLTVVSGGRKKTTRTSEPQKEPVRANRKELSREKRMLLSESEEQLFEELVSGISKHLRVKVKSSNVLRACLSLLLHVQGELLKQCARMQPPQRPRYDEPTSIAVFEEELARIFDSAIRNTKSLD
jgi:hypothetical protein